jgi:endonuclease G
MSNISPQAKWLNRKYWAKVERFARYLAVKYGKVEVVTGSCGNKGKLKNNVGIPTYWYKIIYIPKINNYVAFLAPNTNTGMKKAKLKEYRATLEDIKKICKF